MSSRSLAIKIFLTCLGFAGIIFARSASATTFTPIRVHAGGPSYTDSQGQVWSADTDFSGGDVYSTTSPISNTSDPALYQTERYGSFSYQFPVPNGNYNVLLKFAEIYFTSPGERIFNVAINGTQVLTNFDIVAAAGAPLTAIDETFPVAVTNGTITVQFIPGSANFPKVSAIGVTPSSASSSSGSTTLATTAQGQLSLSPASFAFGNVNIGTSASQTFALSNTGTAAITFSTVSVSGAGFNATGASSGLMLNPSQSATLTVTFTPASAAAVTGNVTFTTNAANPSAAISLSGTGVQPPTVNHSAVLTWDPSTSSGVVGYYVYRGSAAAGPFAVLNASPVSATTYTDETVQSGQAYYYVVTSVNSSNVQSAYSNPVSVTIP
jgi:Malectin domain/Abnormal spindle-like microcephaly-assoc'd, ASPM-SPD-2-Hydin